MIKKQGSQYIVVSEKSKHVMGRYKTKSEAQRRLRQIEYFKHLKKS